MAEIQVKVSSVTNATRGRKILENNGFYARIKRSSDIGPKDGCGYSIYFKGNKEKGVELLRNSGIRIVEVIEN